MGRTVVASAAIESAAISARRGSHARLPIRPGCAERSENPASSERRHSVLFQELSSQTGMIALTTRFGKGRRTRSRRKRLDARVPAGGKVFRCVLRASGKHCLLPRPLARLPIPAAPSGASPYGERLSMDRTVLSALSVRTSPERYLAERERMGLAHRMDSKQKLYRRLLVCALERKDEARNAAIQPD